AQAERPVVVLNSLSWDRREWLNLEGAWVEARVPALGYTVVDCAAAAAGFARPRVDASRLENDKLALQFNADGSIRSLIDKEHGREVLAADGAGNVLAIYRDSGDDWDIPMDYRERAPDRPVLEATEIVADGPRAALRHSYRIGRSVIRQAVALVAGSRRVALG